MTARITQFIVIDFSKFSIMGLIAILSIMGVLAKLSIMGLIAILSIYETNYKRQFA